MRLFLGPISSLVLFAHPGVAEPLTFGLGVGAFPQYEGSADYDVRPLPSFRGTIGQVSFRSSGPGIEADLIRSRAVDAGPILRYDFGRDPSSIDNPAVSALPKIEPSVFLGGYFQANIPVSEDFGTFLSPRLSVLTSVGAGPTAVLVEPSVGVLRRSDKWTFGGRISTTFANNDYMDSYFSVGASSPAGLEAFSAGPGFKDVGASLFANYQISERWSAAAVAGYKRLIGDASESPIVRVAGDRNQLFLGLGISYSFD